jgi:[ribosomal protein S5]-alanine N-acetyltransferase
MVIYKLITERLILRNFSIDDITATYINALNDMSIIGLTEARHTNWTTEKIKSYIGSSNQENKSILLGIFIKENNKPIGNIRLFNFHPIHKRCELGILLYDKGEWGKGYATEALRVVSMFVFDTLKYHRIVADYYSSNIASKKIFDKAGFEIEGVFKEHFFVNNNYEDSVRVGITNKEE